MKTPTPINSKNKNQYKLSRSFKALVKKEFFHIIRDVRTMLILFCMPIAQIILFGFALSVEVKNANFALLDLSHNSLSQEITLALSQNRYFSFFGNIHSKQDLQHIFDDNQIDLALIFPPTFNQDKTLQILLDSSDPNRASTINVYALNILQNSLLDQRNINLTSSPNIIPLTTLLFNPQGKSIYTFVPGLLGMILMIICALMTSISIVREKEQGSMEVLLISPIKPIFVILSKLTPYFLLSCLILAVVLLVCVFLLDLKINGNPLLLFGYCMLYISLALSIGLLVSNLAKTQVVAMLVCALLFLMPIMMLSGMMFPIKSMPQILQYLSHIIPTKWFIIGLKKIMIEGLGITYILQELIILISMLSVVVLLSLKTFKIRL